MVEGHAVLHRVVTLLTMQQNVIDALLDQVVELRLQGGRIGRGASPSRSDDPVRRPGQAVIGEMRT